MKKKQKQKKMKYVIPVLMFTALLSGCSYNHNVKYDVAGVDPGTLNQQLALEKKLKLMQAQVSNAEKKLKKEKGELSIAGHSVLIQQLQKAHIQVVHVGQAVRVIMPNAYLFNPDSANVKTAYINKIMPMVTKLIRHYKKVNVSVTAYGDYTNNIKRAKALTASQAEVIASELWSRGINACLLYAKGDGVNHPIATNHTPQGRFSNRRVEIRFKYTVPRVM